LKNIILGNRNESIIITTPSIIAKPFFFHIPKCMTANPKIKPIKIIVPLALKMKYPPSKANTKKLMIISNIIRPFG
jgi:hypothetical protein